MTTRPMTCDAFNDALDDACDAPATRCVLDVEASAMYPVCDRHIDREIAHQKWVADRD